MNGERGADLEVEALITDRYIDSLFAARDRRMRPSPGHRDAGPDVREATQHLEAGLPRVHPSFRFEERLASELQVQAAGLKRSAPPPLAMDTEHAAAPPTALQAPSPLLAPAPRGRLFAGRLPPAGVPRPLLIGGALTSAALSIAGAYVAWRRGHPPLDPMVRAVRAAHQTGLARRFPARTSRLLLRGTSARGR